MRTFLALVLQESLLLDDRLAHLLTFQPFSGGCQTSDELTVTCFSSAIQQAAVVPYVAVATRAAALGRLGKYQDALANLQTAEIVAETLFQQELQLGIDLAQIDASPASSWE